ncbi:MAG TPA: response regulator transcription factor [Candidatus Deferrimicrobiaceae bacterium]|jgi:DNA-binding NarL/FixJ family response regulator
MIRLMIVDDHPIVRKGLRQALLETGDLDVVGEGGNEDELRALLENTLCDVLLLDIALPGRNGLEVLAWLRETHPRIAVIILSTHKEPLYAVRALKGGAHGYVTKLAPPEELVAAIRLAAAGRKYMGPDLAEQVAGLLSGNLDALPHESLSSRELEVLKMISRGCKPQEIADALALSVKTIGTYRDRLLRKMNMASNADLVRYAAEHDL